MQLASAMYRSNKPSDTSQVATIVAPRKKVLNNKPRWRHGREIVHGPRRKWVANGRRSRCTSGSRKRTGNSKIRVRPNTAADAKMQRRVKITTVSAILGLLTEVGLGSISVAGYRGVVRILSLLNDGTVSLLWSPEAISRRTCLS